MSTLSGILMGAALLGGSLAAGTRRVVACGQCFPWAYREVTQGKGGTLVHGTVAEPLSIPEHRYVHAWVERGGTVYDWQTMEAGHGGNWTGKGYPIPVFRKLFKPQDEKRYTADQARVAILKHRHMGPWE